MNIFFLDFDPRVCAFYYCDQHVNKILLEVVQMLYTCIHCSGISTTSAPLTKSGANGYRKAHVNHPMTMWVRSSKENYKWACRHAASLALEYHKRYSKVHACTKHVEWLSRQYKHIICNEDTSPTAYYAPGPPGTTNAPECMPDEYKDPSLVKSYMLYYRYEKFKFARYKKLRSGRTCTIM